MMESTSGSAVVLRISGDPSVGVDHVDQCNQQTLLTNTIDGRQMLSLELNNSYAGDLVPSDTTTLSGNLRPVIFGGTHDGLWQRNGASSRHLVTLSTSLTGVNTMQVMDTRLNSRGAAANRKVPTGTVANGVTPSCVGRSLITDNTVSHAFKGGTPAAGFFDLGQRTIRNLR
jgi:hypothetical protein